MSVIIKGMEMPDNCHVCVAGYGGCCFVAPAEADGICPDNGRADFCPLIEIPDVDLVWIKHVYECMSDYFIPRMRIHHVVRQDIEEALKDIPIIIPAEQAADEEAPA